MKNKRNIIEALKLQNDVLKTRIDALQSENDLFKTQHAKLLNLASEQFATELSMLKKLIELEAALSKAKSENGKR